MKAVRLATLSWLLSAMLALVPPSGAVCWPLPDGSHIHIGWSDAAGRPTAGLVVYAHRPPSRAIVNPHVGPHRVSLGAGLSALLAPDVVNTSDLRPMTAAALGLLPLLSLCWLCMTQDQRLSQAEPQPLDRPPSGCPAV